MNLGLDRMHRALADINLPHFPIIQILGTNGKGSTSAFLASIAEEHGLRCGLYLSPHFLSVRERISINGQLQSEKDWLFAINSIAQDTDIECLTYFEIITLLAVWIFAEKKVDLAILEAGLGGKNDATSSLKPQAHCFAPVAMDHAAVIGPTLTDIANDKAGAIKPGTRVFSCRQSPNVKNILCKSCGKFNSTPVFTNAFTKKNDTNWLLNSETQKINAGLAVRAWEWFAGSRDMPVIAEKVEKGLSKAFLPGRLQKLILPDKRSVILDGAHNPHAIQALVKQQNLKPGTVIYSALADKDWQTSLSILCHAFPKSAFYPIQLSGSRALHSSRISDFLVQAKVKIIGRFGNIREALQISEGNILICGSLYLLSEFYKIYPQYLGPFKP